MVPPFDYRTAQQFQGIADQEVAMWLHADILGGTPGYRDLTDSVPQSMVEMDHWLVGHVLNPAHALFGETEYLLREDPTITDRALYQRVLAVIAGGKTTPVGSPPLWGVMPVASGTPWTYCEPAVLSAGPRMSSPGDGRIYAIADPIIRFGMLIVRPRQAMYEERRAPSAR